jgi:hypothetical protein
MADWLWDRLEFLGDLRKHRIARWLFLFWAISGAYDLCASQFIPTEWSQKWPKIYQLVAMTTGWLSVEGWMLIGAAILVVFAVEYAWQHSSTMTVSRSHSSKIAIIAFASIVIVGCLNWSRLSEQIFRVDEWSLCQG